MENRISKERLTDELIDANGFEKDALELNRAGEFAPAQRKTLMPNLMKALLYSLVPSVVLVYILFTQKLTTTTVILLIVIACLAAVGYYVLYRATKDMLGKQVLMVEGTGVKDMQIITTSKGRQRKKRYYVIGDKRFQVNRQSYEAFVDDLTYRAYYTPSSNQLINIEVLG